MMKLIITMVAGLLMMGCNGITTAKQMSTQQIEQPTLPDRLVVGKNILSRDTVADVAYTDLDEEQCIALARQTGLKVPDDAQLIGGREIDQKHSLAAYRIPVDGDSLRFKVYLVVLNKDGSMADAIDVHEFHTSEHQGPMRLGGNRFYTTDAELRFDDSNHFTLHRVMTLTSLYLKDHTLTECWRVEWDNHYEITEDGRFRYLEQQETTRKPAELEDPMIEEYKSRDLPEN